MLDNLSTEMVEHVASLVDKQDVLSLRLTCRKLYGNTWSAFGNAFFNTVDLDFCPVPMQNLRRIAYDDKLRTSVRQLRVGVVCRHCQNPPGHALGSGFQWTRETGTTTTGALSLGDDSSSAANQVAYELREWLANLLINCRAISIHDSCGELPEQEGTDTSLSTTDALRILFFAIAGLPVHTFLVSFGRIQPLLNPQQLPAQTIASSHFLDAWSASLTRLELGWLFLQDHIFDMAVQLVAKAKALRTLRINGHLAGLSSEFLRRLSERHREGALEPLLPCIKSLSLASLSHVSTDVLLSFLSHFSTTLTTLHMSFIELAADNTWADVFAQIGGALPCLESICVRDLRVKPPSGRAKKILFCPFLQWQDAPGAGRLSFTEVNVHEVFRVSGICYTGPRDALQKVVVALGEESMSVEPARRGGQRRDCVGERLPNSCRIAGRLRADKVEGFGFP